jgi:hypothetical protein
MEVAILKTSGGYERTSRMHKLSERCDSVYAEIKSKSDKYGRPSGTHINLLLYATDYRFDLMGSEGDLIAHLLGRRQHNFRTVMYTRLFPDAQAWNRVLFPLSSVEIRKLESEKMLRQISSIVFDPREEIVVLDREGRPIRKQASPPTSE